MGRTTILLADDEHTLRENLAQVLGDEGFEVISCGDGAQALKVLRQQSIDALITDLRMPGVTGMDLIQQARKLAPDAVIMIATAFGQVESAVSAMKMGVHDYLCKPLIFDEVIFKLKRLLEQERIERENRVLRERIRHSPEKTDGPVTSDSSCPIPDTNGRSADVSHAGSISRGHAPGSNGATSAAARMEPVVPAVTDLRSALRDFERKHIQAVLAEVGGNKALAAQRLGIGLSSLYRKLEEVGDLDPRRAADAWPGRDQNHDTK